jgi:putative hemolysin
MLMAATTSSVTDKGPGFAEVRAGELGVRLARNADELDAIQALRYRIFYQEMGARADATTSATGRDRDRYDDVADHLVVLDHALGEGERAIVGTYRLIRRPAAERVGQFYSEDEYDLAPLLAFEGQILELGRSCVAPAYRQRAVLQLLWRGIASYIDLHNIDLMFGCASLPGIDPDAVASELSYLYYHHLAPKPLRPRALPHRYIDMRRIDRDELDPKRALIKLPPLIKGYLRIGGFVGDGAVIDPQFNTTDVAVVVKTALVTEKYLRHFELLARDEPDPT